MIRSMTGFGTAEFKDEKYYIKCDVRSLNGKYFELNLRIPRMLQPREAQLRSFISSKLSRGSCTVQIELRMQNGNGNSAINFAAAESYIKDFSELAEKFSLDKNYFLSSISNLPDVLQPVTEAAGDDVYKMIEDTLKNSFLAFDEFRITEGKSIENEFELMVQTISTLLEDVKEADPQRIQRIRERLGKNIEQYISNENVDASRLEQEVIYYVEKLTIAEEVTRLSQHCKYFSDTMKQEISGRKLSFIAQEIGREINTIGSKANDFVIQQKVVQMKDELEKIKELVLNVL